MPGLRTDDEVGEAQVEARRAWCLRILSTPERSVERREVFASAMASLNMRRSRLYDVLRDYQTGGVEGLQRKERSDKGQPRVGADDADPADLQEIWLGYATDPRRSHQTVAGRIAGFRAMWRKSHEGAIHASDVTLGRWLKAVHPALLMTRREAGNALRRRLSLTAEYGNAVWQADQRQADLFVAERAGVDETTGEVRYATYRPLLFSFVDYHSGLVMGSRYYKGAHQAYGKGVVEATLLDAIYPQADCGRPYSGVPEAIYWDNGGPHVSHWMRQVAHSLGVELIYSIPGEPTSHGFIEGFHRLVKDRFEAQQPNFVGGDNREESRPLAMRLVDDGEEAPPALLTLDELNARWLRWLAEEYDHASYKGGASRCSRWLGSVSEERRAVPRPERLALEILERAERQVRAGAFELQTITYTAPHLGELNDLRVEVRYHREHFEHVWVMNRGEVFCVAHPRDTHLVRSAESRSDLRAAQGELREAKRGLRESREHLTAAAAAGLVNTDDAAAAAAVIDRTRRELTPKRAAALRQKMREMDGRGRPGQAEVVPLVRPPAEVPEPAKPDQGLYEVLPEAAPAARPSRAEEMDAYLR